VKRLQKFDFDQLIHHVNGKENLTVNAFFIHPLVNVISMVRNTMMEDIKNIMSMTLVVQ
jgi:hypothetical protein